MKLTNLALVIGTLIVTAACGGEASLTGLDSDAPVPASKNITGEAYLVLKDRQVESVT